MPTFNDTGGSLQKKSTVSAPTSVASSCTVNFLKDLDRVQEQQIHFSKKIEKEKRRKQQLETDIKVVKIFHLYTQCAVFAVGGNFII